MLDPVTDLTRAADDYDSLQTKPLVLFPVPVEVVDDGGGPGFDTTVVAIDGCVPADLAFAEA